ncbi:glycosyltransferase [Fictibacillus sp. FJAT-27399]|uniref:glycosyltransferase n=1 Tax=Fictibacillus sp. FJAT-27399 TaxID=1729689 RepID=UPI0007818C43|nr:glycosyltransferase [Fictibacillus sp. FJAT-27399]
MSKKIALFLPSLRGGGAERVMLNIAKGLVTDGYDVDLVVINSEGAYLSQVPSNVRIVDLEAPRVFQSLLPLIKYLKQSKPYSILCAMNHINIIGVLAVKLAKVNTRIVISEHNNLTQSLLHSRNYRDKILPFFMRYFYPKADGIVAVSEGVAEDLALSLNLPKMEIKVIYNPIIDSELIKKSKERVDHPWFQDDQPPVILSVGRLTEQKDFPTLLHAFYEIRKRMKVRLIILGEGEKRSELETLIKKLELEKDVDLQGFVENPYGYMRSCDLFVLSSKWEGFGNVLVEALASGTSVVSTDCPSGPREILKDGLFGSLVPVGDYKTLADIIYLSITDPALKFDYTDFNEHLNKMKTTTVLDKYKEVLNG